MGRVGPFMPEHLTSSSTPRSASTTTSSAIFVEVFVWRDLMFEELPRRLISAPDS